MANNPDWATLAKEVLDLTEKHATEIGRAISAWNLYQDTLGRLFAEVINPSSVPVALAIWYSQSSDRGQRAMLKAAAKATYGQNAKMYKEIKWVCEQGDKIAEDRNNVVHIGYSITPSQDLSRIDFIPRGIGVYPRADKMSQKNAFAEIRAIEKNCKELINFITNLAILISDPKLVPWPQRPAVLRPAAHPSPTQATRKRPKK